MKTKNLTSLTSIAPVIGSTGLRPPSIPTKIPAATAGVVFLFPLSVGSDDEESKDGLEFVGGFVPGIGVNTGEASGTAKANSNMDAAAMLFALAGARSSIGAVNSLIANSNRFTGDRAHHRAQSAAAQRFWRTVSASRRRSHDSLAEGTLVAFTD